MPGQATVTIRDKQWTCSVANTTIELVTGLSGVPDIPADTGMLFDLGMPLTQVTINMSQMLFPLDVVFMDSDGVVLGVISGLYPGAGETFQSDIGVRYFLEMNAGESTGILPGDEANIEITGATQGWIAPVVTLAGVVMVGAMMGKMGKTIADTMFGKPKEKPVLYGPRGERLLPQTREKLYQRGADGYPVGADRIMRDAWGPIPDPDQPFWSGRGFVKPVKIYGWQFSPDYNHWRAYVRFPDGTETWTSPMKQTSSGRKPASQVKSGGSNPQTGEQLEFLPDSPEFLAYTIDDIGYREKIDTAFQNAIARAKAR